MTDFERFIGHENFGYYIFMAFAVKAIRQCLIAETVPNASEAGLGGCGKVKGCNRFLTGCNRRLPRLQPSNQVAIQAKLGLQPGCGGA